MKIIELTKGKVTVVDEKDFAWLSRFSWFVECPTNSPHLVYAVRKIRKPNGKYGRRLMHREITGAPDGVEIDHHNGDGLDNRRKNLRPATPSQNQANARKHADAQHSIYKGVTWHKGNEKYQASIQFQKRRHYLGHFSNQTHAARAYNAAAIKFFGDYARLNKI